MKCINKLNNNGNIVLSVRFSPQKLDFFLGYVPTDMLETYIDLLEYYSIGHDI